LHPGAPLRSDSRRYCTVSVVVAECDTVPLVPVTVSVNVPRCEFRATVTVSVDVPEPVTLAGANDDVPFLGTPLTLSPTEPVKPLSEPTVTV